MRAAPVCSTVVETILAVSHHSINIKTKRVAADMFFSSIPNNRATVGARPLEEDETFGIRELHSISSLSVSYSSDSSSVSTIPTLFGMSFMKNTLGGGPVDVVLLLK